MGLARSLSGDPELRNPVCYSHGLLSTPAAAVSDTALRTEPLSPKTMTVKTVEIALEMLEGTK